ncbi:MAG: zinc-binding alcohol dehydrogenase [Hyphomonadaceae bacterium]|jgi:threonine dehydrogenase-like Zn-dependent dehydrogenase|nr:zinc-binding alcohol dehydrogenase [Hyphomonadaceae bacterium]
MTGRGVKMMARRSTGKVRVARALWYVGKGTAELRTARLLPAAPGEALVRALFSGISRGTERLVLEGGIGRSEWERMRCPMQEGSFPFPVKYGYCATGVVEDGPADIVGRKVFCLHPHQNFFTVPVTALAPIPDDVPARRATLAANMETALNALWDSGAGPGDRIVVVGAGIVGLLVAALAARLPAATVTAVDLDQSRRPLAESLGAAFAKPATAPADADIVFHCSATSAGLNTAIACAGLEAAIVELSWYGSKPVEVELGGAFHSRRLKLVSSQVGMVSPSRRPRWDYRRRLSAALRLLAEPALDALVKEEIAFDEAPKRLPQILAPGTHGLAPVIRYPDP